MKEESFAVGAEERSRNGEITETIDPVAKKIYTNHQKMHTFHSE